MLRALRFGRRVPVLAKVKYRGSFRVTTRTPATKRPGRYGVTGRCGGGNLGFLKHLTVHR